MLQSQGVLAIARPDVYSYASSFNALRGVDGAAANSGYTESGATILLWAYQPEEERYQKMCPQQESHYANSFFFLNTCLMLSVKG